MKSWEDWFGSMAAASERSKSQSKQRNKWNNALKVETYGSREERQTDEAKTGKRRKTKSHAVYPGQRLKVKDGKNSRRKKEILNGQTNSGSADEATGAMACSIERSQESEHTRDREVMLFKQESFWIQVQVMKTLLFGPFFL